MEEGRLYQKDSNFGEKALITAGVLGWIYILGSAGWDYYEGKKSNIPTGKVAEQGTLKSGIAEKNICIDGEIKIGDQVFVMPKAVKPVK